MTKNLYIPVRATRAADEALKNLMAKYEKKSEYVPFYNGKHSRKQSKSFDTYFYGNLK